MYDTIIIGAGMSGLAAGIRLAYYDQRVCILERHYTIGGLNSFYRLRGRDYDVGLHAVTNFTPKGTRKGPLARILRQLRFRWEDFRLSPQIGSVIAFPGVKLRFGNGIQLLESEISRWFPRQVDSFRRLLERIIDYDDLDQSSFELSTRKVLAEIFDDRQLVEMILCPVMWYGNAREDDMDFGQFCIMFRSIFMEGLARPLKGIRLILKNLVRRFRELGGELRLRSSVDRIHVEGDRAAGIVLDDGQQLTAKRILSSAGWVETMRMCDDRNQAGREHVGQVSFVESTSILDVKPAAAGFNETILFYNDSERFHWRRPADLCDLRTGVVCSPNNYLYDDANEADKHLSEGVIRVSSLANHDRWSSLAEEDYAVEKLHWYDRVMASAVRFIPEIRQHVVDTDFFTPKTIRRFTCHDNGAVYGATRKHWDGKTHLANLFVCGSDQGLVGIVGAIVSGITMANRHCLSDF